MSHLFTCHNLVCKKLLYAQDYITTQADVMSSLKMTKLIVINIMICNLNMEWNVRIGFPLIMYTFFS